MARFKTKVVIDIESGLVLEAQYCDWDGPIALCKGGASKAEMAVANQQNAQDFQLAQQQLAMQQQQINMVDPTLQKIIANGGLPPGIQQALTAQALNTIPQQYGGVLGQLNNQLVQRGMTGGQFAGSGGVASGFGALGAAEANQQSNLLGNIQQMKLGGLQTALNTSLGIGQMYGQNTNTFTSGANQALGAGVQAAANTDAAQTGFLGSLFGALAAPVSAAGAAGGFGKLF